MKTDIGASIQATAHAPSAPALGLAPVPDLASYDNIVVFFSGGKDSLACLLHLLELGVPRERIELHHHCVDGREGSSLMDWACTHSYCEAVARALGVRMSHSWRRGGFEAEMLRENSATGATMVPDGDGAPMLQIGGNGPADTRRKFPQMAASLSVRWCSAAVKIDVGDRWLTNARQFQGKRTLVVTGERAQESACRARYAAFEPHRADRRDGVKRVRHIDHWRAVHGWSQEAVWAIIARWKVQAHPAYWLGFGRCSCLCCVFGTPDQWATVKVISPRQFEQVSNYEKAFGVTIHRSRSVEEQAALGTPWSQDPFWIAVANAEHFTLPIILDEWTLPPGASSDSGGPP